PFSIFHFSSAIGHLSFAMRTQSGSLTESLGKLGKPKVFCTTNLDLVPRDSCCERGKPRDSQVCHPYILRQFDSLSRESLPRRSRNLRFMSLKHSHLEKHRASGIVTAHLEID